MHAVFEYQAGEEAAPPVLRITLRGSDRSVGKASIEIQLNDHRVFRGDSPFTQTVFSECTWQIDSSCLVAGKNRLSVKNLAKAPNRQAVLIHSGTLELAEK